MIEARQNDRCKKFKVVHLCYADDRGGAAIGARRLHQAMLAQGIESKLVVVKKYTSDPTVIELPGNQTLRSIVTGLGKYLSRAQKSGNPVIRSLNIVPTGTSKFLNSMDADIIQMHWVAADTISIGEITQIDKPVVWKLPDMWAFSGAEHYLMPEDIPRYQQGYTTKNRQTHEKGIDVDHLVWLYKKYKWRNAKFSIVGPSKWIANCAAESVLFKNLRIRHIPNPLDLNLYKPKSQLEARKAFGLSQGKKLIMFGAMHATKDRRKGFHYLKRSLTCLSKFISPDSADLVVLGSNGPTGEKLSGYKVHYLGVIRDETEVVDAYNVADVFVLPAEADNLPNVVKEATCCGVPCVGFNVGGMPDLVDHMKTGYLATPFDTQELAEGIAWAVQHRASELSAKVRALAETKHSQDIVVSQYLGYYQEILQDTTI
tara:strand:- start:288 stop:1574 length:1287 start_codon:yes stop_codon:yes gene_type:complete